MDVGHRAGLKFVVCFAAIGLAFGAIAAAGCTHHTPTDPTASVGKIDAIAASLPEDIRASGRLTVAVNVPNSPNEFYDPGGKLVGFDVDLLNAVASALGLTTDYRPTDFANVIPSVQRGTVDVGMSSLTDTKYREKKVDFVTYFSAGTLWAQRAGSGTDLSHACGKTVAVKATTVQEIAELPTRSEACTDAGRPAIKILAFDDQDQATNALLDGRADAMSADSPVTEYAIKQSDGKLETAGSVQDLAPYGWPVKKGSALGPALQQALAHLIESGQYKVIAANWGIQHGIIDTPVINGAKS